MYAEDQAPSAAPKAATFCRALLSCVMRSPYFAFHMAWLGRGGSDQDGPMRNPPRETGWRIVGPRRASTSGHPPMLRPPPHLILIGELPKLARLSDPAGTPSASHPVRITP